MEDHKVWFSATHSAELTHFDAFIKIGWDEAHRTIRGLPTELPEGVSSFSRGANSIECAVSRKNSFASFRFLRLEVGKSARVFTTELHYLAPATKSPRIGLCAWRDALDGTPITGGQREPALIGRLRTEGLLGDSIPADRWTSHAVLTGLLAPKQNAPSTNVGEQLSELRQEVAYLEGVSEAQSETIRALNARIRDLRAAFSAISTQAEAPLCESRHWKIEELVEWAALHENEIVVLPRAYSGAKRSLYRDDAVIFEALEILAGPYRRMKQGILPPSELERILDESQLRLSPSVAPTVAGSKGDAYFVKWRGQRRFLELHIAKGSGFDEALCFRLYFFFDSDIGKPIVGWLPSHLPNSIK